MLTISDSNILITGGTGSFGQESTDYFLRHGAASVTVFSRDEKKQHDMRIENKNPRIKFFIGDVRSKTDLSTALQGIDFAFHAAALKQVPSCEFFPKQAVLTNIIGTQNIIEAAIEAQCKSVVLLSTDKAAYPINAMGISKAMAEKLFYATSRELNQSRESTQTKFCVTRYGNVMASRGSVIPLFIQQAKSNLPLTITNPEMTRFMMSLNESIQLIEYAFLNGFQGDLFIRKCPSCTIYTLAQAILEIFNSSSEILISGTREGEKKHEILATEEELHRSIDMEQYIRIPLESKSQSYQEYFEEGKPKPPKKPYSSMNPELMSVEETIQILMKLDIIRSNLK